MSTLEELQDDLAAELDAGFGDVATVLPHMPATPRAMSGYLRFEVNHVEPPSTFTRAAVTFTLILYGPTHDFPARQRWLTDRALDVRRILGPAVRIGGQQPPKVVSWRLVSFVEDQGAIGLELMFAPIPFTIPED